MATPKAFVIGAGVTGLVAGWKLAERGWDVLVIEKERHYGGLASTQTWNGFQVDFGPHIYHTVDPRLEKLWEEEFGDLFVKGEFWCKNVKGEQFDQYYDYPLSHESIAKYPKALRDRILAELAQIDPEHKTKAKNYKAYVTALVGPTLQQMFFEQYPQKLWGLSTEEMTANWAPKRIELREKNLPFYSGRWNAVARRGTGSLMDRLVEKLKAHGGKLMLGNGLATMETNGHLIARLILEDGQPITLAPRDVVISTIPINRLAALLGIPCQLNFRGVISVHLAFKRPFLLPEGIHFLYYDSPKVLFHRISEQKRFCAEGFPPDKTFLTAEIAYSPGDAADRLSTQELIQRLLDQVCLVGLAKREDYLDGTAERRPALYPLLTKDYEHHLREVQSRFVRFKSLYTVGGPAEFNYADIHINFLKALDLVDILTDRYAEHYRIKRAITPLTWKRQVNLHGVLVGEGCAPYVIAEGGLNHNGALETACQLVDEALRAGCHAVKFQTYQATNRVSAEVKRVRYAEQLIGSEESLLEMFQRLELSAEDHRKLFAYARQKGIEIFSTPFDCESVDLLESLKTPFYKVASFDLVNLPLLRYIAKTGKPMIVSTGMSTLGEIEEALETISNEGNNQVVLLHCLSAYPANPEEVNLHVIPTLKRTFNLPVGFSDHTLGLFVSHCALALGANVLERHFTLDRMMEGPDHIFSSEPWEMAELMRSVHMINAVLGDGVKRIMDSEYDTINAFKKCLYAKAPIALGEEITTEKIAIKGPGGGLAPKYLEMIVGRKARQAIKKDYPITWGDV